MLAFIASISLWRDSLSSVFAGSAEREAFRALILLSKIEISLSKFVIFASASEIAVSFSVIASSFSSIAF